MRSEDIRGMLRVAGVTAFFTLGLFGLGKLEAAAPDMPYAPLLPSAEVHVDGCAFTVAANRTTYTPGETASLTVVAVNETDHAVTTEVQLTLSSMQPASLGSRMMPLPQPRWSDICAVELAPGERAVRTFATETPLTADQVYSFQMSDADGAYYGADLEVAGAVDRRFELLGFPMPMIFPRFEDPLPGAELYLVNGAGPVPPPPNTAPSPDDLLHAMSGNAGS